MKYAYINGILLSGEEDMKPVSGSILRTDGERIEDIVPEGTDLTGYEVIDLKGKYLLPGLINLHVHLPASGKPKKHSDPATLARLLTSNALFRAVVRDVCAANAKKQLMSGVTTIRTVGGVVDSDTRIRDDIDAGRRIGPRILAGNMGVSVPGGHMAGSLAYAVHSPEEAAACVEKIAAEKPDLIKLMITGGVLDATVRGEPGALKMSPEIVRAAAETAHKHGLMTAAHVESPEGVRVALENGVDTIEHGAKPDAEILRLFRERGARLVATFSPALPFALFDRSVSKVSELDQYNSEIVFEGIIECAKECLREGIPVGLGTDTGCPFDTHYDTWREVYYFKKFCGVDNAFALYTATIGNARVVGIDGETGSLTPGKSADLIAVEGNPLEDLRALRNISLVSARGRLIRDPKVKKVAAIERELDKFL